jgi:hypothetical protein
MIEKALRYIVGLRDAPEPVLEILGRTYTTLGGRLELVTDPMPPPVECRTLTAIRDFMSLPGTPGLAVEMIHVAGPAFVNVLGSLTTHCRQRPLLAVASAVDIRPDFGKWMGVEEFIVMLQSQFLPSGDHETLLKYVSAMKVEGSVGLSDDGVSQTATVRSGVASVAQVRVPNPVTLQPFRTFPEVTQPTSRFVFRVGKDDSNRAPCFKLVEADGGEWQRKAIYSIREWLNREIRGVVVVA